MANKMRQKMYARIKINALSKVKNLKEHLFIPIDSL